MRHYRITPDRLHRRRWLALALAGALTLALGGCLDKLVSAGCKRVKSTELHVAPGKTCNFSYAWGDAALYVVKVTQPPAFGVAAGEGKYLKYVAKPGFTGEDRLRIRVARRGVGHVQWQDFSVTVKVGPKA